MRPRPPPLLVVGLDGASFEVIEPLARAGRLPELSSWLRDGAHAPLPSCVPPMSFPAWSSFLTGLEPGEHGLFDFTQKLPGEYRIRFANATHRRGRSFLARASAAGLRVLCLGVPATFPPEPVNGLLVPGFDSPLSTGSDPRSANDPALYQRIASRAGPWMRPALDESARDEHFHERALGTLLERIEGKERFACEAIAALGAAAGGAPPDLAVVVFSESDTVAHHYWRDHDPASPRHDPRAGATRRGALGAVYERLDAACGALRRAMGPEARCVAVSDHGSGGASRRVVYLGRRLAETGLSTRSARGPAALDAAARAARDGLLQLLPPRLAERAFRRARSAAARVESAARFGGHDWSRTLAFSEEANTQPGVWINLRGRERRGCVDPQDYERVRRDVIDALIDWKLPGGAPVVARARRREDVYRGACVSRAPDVVVELALDEGYGLSLVQTPWSRQPAHSLRTLEPHELAGGRGRGMNGTHRDTGIWIAVGEGLERGPASIAEVAGVLLSALGLESGAGPDAPPPQDRHYAPDDEARVAQRLRALGYLE